MDHTPACASRPEEEWGRLLVEQYEGAPLGVVPLYGGEVWNAAGSRMRLRHIPRCRPGRRQRGMVQQLTNVDVYGNGERRGAPSCSAVIATIRALVATLLMSRSSPPFAPSSPRC